MAFFGALSSNTAYAAGNTELSFEGKVVTSAGVNVTDGTYAMEFKIYTGCSNEPTSSTGCSAVWTEDWTGTGQLVSFTSGTFQVNLGSITAFGSNVPWDTSPLYLSMQISNTQGATCTPAGNFTTNCNGDGVMNPYIELTATPYAEDAGELGGLAATSFGQLATNQTFTGTNTFQPATNITGAIVEQTSIASPTADVFDVQGVGGSADNFIQVTSTGANAGAVNINSLGAGNALTLDSGTTGAVNIGTNANSKTIQIGASNSAVTDTVNVGNNTNASGITTLTAGSLSSTSQTTIQAGANGAASINLSLAAGGGATLNQANEPTVSTSGASEPIAFTVNAGDGGATSGTTGQAGGNGGAVLITSGNGGNASSGSTNGNGGNITLSAGSAGTGTGTAGASGSVIIQNTANSSTAFEIQNAAGQNLFVQGTNAITQTNDITNYTFTGGTTGWAVEGTATGLTQITNQTDVYPSNFGLDSIDDTLAASGTSGIEISASGLTGSSLAAGTYNFGFYAMGSASITNLAVAFNGTGGTCTTNQTAISSSGFTYYTCTTTTSTATTIVTIESTSSSSQTLYISDPQITAGALSSYQLGAYQTNGVNTSSQITFQNTNNSTTAFQIQNSAGTNIFDIDTLDNNVVIGTNVSTNTTNTSLLQLDSVNTYSETETCSSTTNQGAMYFNTSSNTIRACIDGSWTDLASSAALGLLAFGVVSTSGGASNAGDLASTSTASVSGPCKVSWASATTVTVQPCIAYSGGREVMVGTTVPGYTGAQTVSLTGMTTTDRYANLCFATTAGTASNTLALVGAGNAGSTSMTASTIEPTWNPAAPVLCLATIVQGTATNGSLATGGMIYDTRTFVETMKIFAASTAAMSLASTAEPFTTAGEVEIPTGTGVKEIGVVVASKGTAVAGGAPNVIIATSGPGEVQALSGATVTIGDTVEADSTGGQAEALNAGVATAYANLGQALNTANSGGACTSAATCVGSIFLNLDIGYE